VGRLLREERAEPRLVGLAVEARARDELSADGIDQNCNGLLDEGICP